jgi:16S rRNA (cytidine1402-2'-O)-methyltransferase
LVSPGTLFVVATPLGNLGDISERARTTFASVACVAAEDTRRTRILLNHLGVRPRLVSLHAHSSRSRLEHVVSLLESGTSVALVTDAGTPTVSDPGAELVREARSAGIPVVAVPGPSAVAAALSISGFNADRYIFLGFLPRQGKERERLLGEAAGSTMTSVFFESPNRLVDLLDELAARCGPAREVAVARELTKIHEELRSGPLGDVATHYREHPPRGEITVLLCGATPDTSQASVDRTEEVRERARVLLAGGATRRDVAQIVARELQLSRNEAYRMVTAL